jgi:hypothetical protein
MGRAISAVVLAIAVAGCSSDASPSRPEVTLEGTAVRLVYHPDWPPCAGTLKRLDETAQRQSRALGLAVPGKITYRFERRPEDTPCGLGPGGGGCSQGSSTVWATLPELSHEMVHAIVIPDMGSFSVSFFDEGLAVALGGPDLADTAAYATPDATLFGAAPLAQNLYATAGDFVSFLLTRYGTDKMRELLPSVKRGTPAADVDAALARVYGKGFRALVDERTSSGLVFGDSRLGVPECGLGLTEPAPPSAIGFHEDVAVTCSADAIGVADPDIGAAWQYTTVDVPDDGVYRLSTRATADGSVTFRHCVAGEDVVFDTVPVTAAATPVRGRSVVVHAALRAGRHSFRVRGSARDTTTFSLALDRTPTSPTCADGETLDPSLDGIYVAPRAGAGDVAASFRVAEARRATAVLDGATLRICTSGCNSSCTSLPLRSKAALAPGVTYTLVASAPTGRGAAGLAFDPK